MGRWGIEAWENDASADWYDQLFEETNLVHRIAETLILDPEEWFDEIRAAAKLVTLLNKPEIWSTESYRDLATLACDRLEYMVQNGCYSNPQILASIADDIIQQQKALNMTTEKSKDLVPDSNGEVYKFEP